MQGGRDIVVILDDQSTPANVPNIYTKLITVAAGSGKYVPYDPTAVNGAEVAAAILLGLLTTMVGAGVIGDGYNYRETVSPWFRSLFLLQPQPELMAEAMPSFQIHAIAGLLVFAIWPFTRLVHAFSAPIQYLFRPYVIYRDRGDHDPGSRAPRRGWERIGG